MRLKGYKTLQEIFITKLIAVVDNNFDEKYEVKQKALDLSSGKVGPTQTSKGGSFRSPAMTSST